MSDPIDTTVIGPYGAIQNALCEILSAISALNMPPEPIENVEPNGYRPLFLSETDGMVQHTIEHMHAVFRLLNMAYHDQESLKMQVYRLVIQLTEAGLTPSVKTWLDED